MAGLLPASRRLAPVPCVTPVVGGDSMGRQWLLAAAEITAAASGEWPPPAGCGPLCWTYFPPIATRARGMDAGSVRAARDFAAAACVRWGVTERHEDIGIVVSELLTNALRHALPGSDPNRPGWPIRLGLLQSGPSVFCTVTDPSSAAPVQKEPGRLAETGRGLQVVSALSDEWGYLIRTTPDGTGKIVWAMFLMTPLARVPRKSPGAA